MSVLCFQHLTHTGTFAHLFFSAWEFQGEKKCWGEEAGGAVATRILMRKHTMASRHYHAQAQQPQRMRHARLVGFVCLLVGLAGLLMGLVALLVGLVALLAGLVALLVGLVALLVGLVGLLRVPSS